MDLPPSFQRLGDRFYQGLDRDVGSLDELATHLAATNNEDRQGLRRFLEYFLSSRTESARIAEAMNSVCNSYHFYDGEETRAILKLVLAKL